MSSNLVQVGATSGKDAPTFMQNGQVDWVAFAKSIWSTSSVVLQRFASAGVQPITFGAGIALASQFRLDHVGKKRMHDAIEGLNGAWSYKNLLYFGFGTRSFVEVMADSQLGVNCIALCSSLAEVHDEHACAWILEELWKLNSFPHEYLPSHSQFTYLVKACSGVLAKTDFGVASDRMVGHVLNTDDTAPCMADAEDVAKALRGLSGLSNGSISRITVTGGIECAFIASFAHWLLNLKVYVEDEAGTVLYQDGIPEEAQVTVTYRPVSELSVVQVSSTTYVLREVEDILSHSPVLDQVALYFRTPWDRCLARVFGSGFSALIESPTILGDFFGSVARIYRGLAMGESDVGKFARKEYIDYVESSYGKGFTHSVISIFPELDKISGLFDQMQLALDTPLKEALRTTEKTVLDLAQLCKCSHCTRSGIKSKASCRLVIAIAVREMVSTISCTRRDKDVLPTIRGIRCVYGRIQTQLAGTLVSKDPPLLAVALGLRMEDMHGDFTGVRSWFDPLSHPMEIFSGQRHHSRYESKGDPLGREYCTATMQRGVCYYLDCLREMSSQAENARMVHILPGHIQMGDRQFDSTCDPVVPSQPSASLSSVSYSAIEEFDPTRRLYRQRSADISIKAFGQETTMDRELIVYFKAEIPAEPAMTLRPGYISRQVLLGTGILTCERERCTSRLNLPCLLIKEGWRVPENINPKSARESRKPYLCLIWPQLDDPARCIAIHQASAVGSHIYLRGEECISCCTNSLIRELKPDRQELCHIV